MSELGGSWAHTACDDEQICYEEEEEEEQNHQNSDDVPWLILALEMKLRLARRRNNKLCAWKQRQHGHGSNTAPTSFPLLWLWWPRLTVSAPKLLSVASALDVIIRGWRGGKLKPTVAPVGSRNRHSVMWEGCAVSSASLCCLRLELQDFFLCRRVGEKN